MHIYIQTTIHAMPKLSNNEALINLDKTTNRINVLQLYQSATDKILPYNLTRLTKVVGALTRPLSIKEAYAIKMFMLGFYHRHSFISPSGEVLSPSLAYVDYPTLTALFAYLAIHKNKNNQVVVHLISKALSQFLGNRLFDWTTTFQTEIASCIRSRKNHIYLNFHDLIKKYNPHVIYTILLNLIGFFKDYAVRHSIYNFHFNIQEIEKYLTQHNSLNNPIQKASKKKTNVHKSSAFTNQKHSFVPHQNTMPKPQKKHTQIQRNISKTNDLHKTNQSNKVEKKQTSTTNNQNINILIARLYFDNVVMRDFKKTKVDMNQLRAIMNTDTYKKLRIGVLAEKAQFKHFGKYLIKLARQKES